MPIYPNLSLFLKPTHSHHSPTLTNYLTQTLSYLGTHPHTISLSHSHTTALFWTSHLPTMSHTHHKPIHFLLSHSSIYRKKT